MKIGYFDTEEFLCPSGEPSPFKHVVRDELIELLNKIRERFGYPIVVTSGYRSVMHNQNIGGAKYSLHITGQAADIRPTWKHIEKLDQLKAICLELNPNGGVGFYHDRAIVHVDVRGYKARWTE